MSVVAVVVTYNRRDLLCQCIQSLREQTRQLDEIIVVNNGSTDGTREWLNTQGDLFVIHQGNTGGAGGFYTGIKTAYERKHDWVWCMDDDVIPSLECLEILLQKTHIIKDAVAFVPCRYYDDGRVAIGNRHLIDERWHSLLDFRKPLSNSQPVQAFTFEGPLIAGSAIGQVGYPDRNYFILYDDVDYAFRLSRVGDCYYVEEAKMLKMIPAVVGFKEGSSKLKQYYRWRNHIYFMRKSLGWRSPLKIFFKFFKDSIKILLRCVEQRSLRPLQYFAIMFISIFHASLGKMGRTRT